MVGIVVHGNFMECGLYVDRMWASSKLCINAKQHLQLDCMWLHIWIVCGWYVVGYMYVLYTH